MAKYSIVVPFHNEEENVTVLYARLKQVMEQVGDSYELVLVCLLYTSAQPRPMDKVGRRIDRT